MSRLGQSHMWELIKIVEYQWLLIMIIFCIHIYNKKLFVIFMTGKILLFF